jgi:hypothetical protein
VSYVDNFFMLGVCRCVKRESYGLVWNHVSLRKKITVLNNFFGFTHVIDIGGQMVHGNTLLVIRKNPVLRYAKVGRTRSNLEPNWGSISMRYHNPPMKFDSDLSVDETFTQVMLTSTTRKILHACIYVCNPWNQLAFALMNKIEWDQVWSDKGMTKVQNTQ